MLSAKRWLQGAVVVGALVVGTSSAFAQVPGRLTHQGRLFDGTGLPLTDTINVTFKLYDAASGGAELWSETVPLTVEDGYFSVVLGETTPFDTSILNGTERWLGISVAGDAEMTPRAGVRSVPYAVLAGDVTGTIHPTAVEIEGVGVVIDDSGQWVGDPSGLVGPTGPAGSDGPTGPAGPQGPQGPAGADGAMGPAGATGATGPIGPTGAVGATGPVGPAGPQGPIGTIGATGPAGPQGPAGPASVVSTASSNGQSAALTAGGAYAFISPTTTVAVAAGQSVHVWVTSEFGSTVAGGATNLRLAVCRRLGAAGTPVDNGADYVEPVTVPQNTRLPLTLTTRFTGLAAGSYQFGMCGYVTAAGNLAAWNLSFPWSRTHVVVTAP